VLDVVGYRIPVKGKHAKMNPVPIKAINAECLDPVGEGFPGLMLRMSEVTRAKNPAKT
jgi:hypothetical protein